MESKDIKKYLKKSVPQLRKLAQSHFNRFIRERDAGKPCISCGSQNANQAGHYLSAGHYPSLAMDEDNCHNQCTRCNLFLSGNLIFYRQGLLKRIGEHRVHILEDKAAYVKRNGFKHDRMSLIEKILKYKALCKNLGE